MAVHRNMAKILIRRMSDAARLSLSPVPAAGEPIWTTDTKKLYVGDAVTAGGIPVDTVGGTASNCILVTSPIITGSATASVGTSVTLTANGSHSALEDDSRVSIAKYTWTKPDNTTVDGSSLTVTASTTVGGTVAVKCRATDSLGNVSADTAFTITSTAANTLPTTPTVVTDLPTSIVRSSSYTVKMAATDADGDAITFNAINLIGCSASQLTGITAATGIVVTVDPQADTVSIGFKAVDSKGGQSVGTLTLTRSGTNIVNPTGTTGFLTPGQTHVINIPDWADVATFTGAGGAGGAITCTNDPYGYPYTFISGELLAQATYVGSDADANYKYAWDVPYVDAYTNHGFRVIADTMTKPAAGCYRNYTNTSSMRYYELLTAATSAGASTTITGAVTATFSGSAAGYTTSPAQTSQIKSLPVGTGRTLSVYVPLTGTFKADWS